MSSIINSLTTDQFDAIIAAYGTVLNWADQAANYSVWEDIIF